MSLRTTTATVRLETHELRALCVDVAGVLERAVEILDAVPNPHPDLVELREIVWQPLQVVHEFIDDRDDYPHPEDKPTARNVAALLDQLRDQLAEVAAA